MALDKVGNYNLTNKNTAYVNPDLHTTTGVGLKPDLTGAAGSGDWVSKEAIIPRLRYEWNINGSDLFYTNSIFLNLIRGANRLAIPGVENFARGNKVDIFWEAPAMAQDLAKLCEIPVTDQGVQVMSLGMQDAIGGALGIRCGCTPMGQCGAQYDNLYSTAHVAAKMSEIVRNSMQKIDFKILTKLKTLATATVKGNDYTRYGQILQGIAEITDTLANPLGNVANIQDPMALPLIMSEFNWVILANPFTIKELQLTPSSQWEFKYDKGTVQRLNSLGVKFDIQGIPVIEVPTSIVDTTDGWMIVPLDTIIFAVACEKFYETPEAVFDPTTNKMLVDDTKFGYRMIYGIEEIGKFLGNRLVGLKGKALNPAVPAGAWPVYQVGGTGSTTVSGTITNTVATASPAAPVDEQVLSAMAAAPVDEEVEQLAAVKKSKAKAKGK